MEMFAELQGRLKRSRLKLNQIATETGLSVSIVRGIKVGSKPNPTIHTYETLMRFLDQHEARKPPRQVRTQ